LTLYKTWCIWFSMSNQRIDNQRDGNVLNNAYNRTKDIIFWLRKIERSKLSITKFFEKHSVPFSRSQYYLYDRRFRQSGESGLRDKRNGGGNRKLTAENEAFITGCVESNPDVSPQWIQQALDKRFDVTLSPSGVTRVLQRLNPDGKKRSRGRPKKHVLVLQHNSCGGFELIFALGGCPRMPFFPNSSSCPEKLSSEYQLYACGNFSGHSSILEKIAILGQPPSLPSR